MNNFTTETYIAKREILAYTKKLSAGLFRPNQKFVSDMIYGMTASGSVLLTDISDTLHESIQKGNTVERLSRHLSKGLPEEVRLNYAREIGADIPENPVILLDDSDASRTKFHHAVHCGSYFGNLLMAIYHYFFKKMLTCRLWRHIMWNVPLKKRAGQMRSKSRKTRRLFGRRGPAKYLENSITQRFGQRKRPVKAGAGWISEKCTRNYARFM